MLADFLPQVDHRWIRQARHVCLSRHDVQVMVMRSPGMYRHTPSTHVLEWRTFSGSTALS